MYNRTLSEIDHARASRAKSRVESILGMPLPRNPKVQGVKVGSHEGKPAVFVLITSAVGGEAPVLPQTVEGVDVLLEHCGMSSKEGHYRNNRQKMIIEVRRIANDLAAKFNSRPGYGWPISFKLNNKITVTVAGEGMDDTYRITVKALAGIGMQPPFVADITITQMSTSQQTSEFIKRCEEGLKDLAPTIRADL